MTGETKPPNLEAASQMIDILAMLEAKTRGNLTAQERSLLEQVLYDLRMRFVAAQQEAAGRRAHHRAVSGAARSGSSAPARPTACR